jgi:hypothetical protein
LIVGNLPGKQICSVFYEHLRDQDIFGETAGETFLNFRALRMVAVLAIRTFPAGHLRSDKYPVAWFVSAYTIADRHNLRADFMSLHERRSREPVPFHDIAAADAAGNNLDQHLPRSGFRGRYFFYPNVFVIVPAGNFHFFLF